MSSPNRLHLSSHSLCLKSHLDLHSSLYPAMAANISAFSKKKWCPFIFVNLKSLNTMCQVPGTPCLWSVDNDHYGCILYMFSPFAFQWVPLSVSPLISSLISWLDLKGVGSKNKCLSWPQPSFFFFSPALFCIEPRMICCPVSFGGQGWWSSSPPNGPPNLVVNENLEYELSVT